jgi:RHS repeat-associated protein
MQRVAPFSFDLGLAMFRKASAAFALCCLSSAVAVSSAFAQVSKPGAGAEPSVQRGALGPGWHLVQPSTVSPEQAEALINARGAPPAIAPPMIDKSSPGAPGASGGSAGNRRLAAAASLAAPETPASVSELARALKNDPDLIYQHVRNNIEFYPVWGVQKGALGALIDGSGTAFDQALLLRDLLRAAGYSTATLVRGKVWIPAAEAAAWLGVEAANMCTVSKRLAAGRVPAVTYNVSGTQTCKSFAFIEVDHIRVRVAIGGTNRVFDPSFKPRQAKAGIALASITGYTRSDFLSQAGGSVSAQGALTGIDRAKIRTAVTNYANALSTHIRTNNPHGALHDVLGGPGPIVPDWGSSAELPACSGGVPTARCQVAAPVEMTEANATPANAINAHRATLRVAYRGIDETFTSDEIYGKRLSLTFQATGVPQLRLDGVLRANGTSAAPANVSEKVSVYVRHLAYSGFDQTFSGTEGLSVRTGPSNVYVIANGWGPSSGATLAHYRRQLAQARASGAADDSEAVMGAVVAVLSAQWIAQVSASQDMQDRVKRQLSIWHHGVGIAGFSDASMYVDLPGNFNSYSADDGSESDSTGFFAQMFPLSVLESTSVQQVAGIASAASTVSLIDTAVATGRAIHNITSANFGAVSPSFASWGCSAYSSSIQSAVSQGRVVLPASCALTAAQWSGAGYFAIAPSSITAAIDGGVPTTATVQPTPPAASPVFSGALTPGRGAFKASTTDITVGIGDFPSSLALTRAYSSDDALNDSGLGRGWSHNLGGSAREATAGLRALGGGSALDAVANIASSMVLLDLMADTTRPVRNIVAASVVAKWASEQLENTAVEVRIGASSEQFIRLPDGNYNPPRGSSARLTHSGGRYSYETADRTVLAFNAAGELQTYTLKNGMQARFTYTGGRLTNVTNSLGRELELAYVNGRLDSVRATGNSGDTTGRTVRYGYGGARLTSFTDALGQQTRYGYGSGSNRLEKVFADPAEPTLATLTNAYDDLGRLRQQTDAAGRITRHYFAGSRLEIAAPLGARTVSFFNWQGLPVRAIDPVGRTIITAYDGAGRPTKVTFPEGNSVEYTYDDATCRSAERRCTHNVLTVTARPKPGSALPALTTTHTYERDFNKLESTRNPRGQVTTFTYHGPSGEVASITQPAAAAGQVQPRVTFGYTRVPASRNNFPDIHLLTSETRRVDSGTNTTVTTRTYAPRGQSYVPATVVVDAGTGKLNLTTAFTFDAVGDLTMVDGPRTDVADTQTRTYDALRRVTAVTDARGKATRTYFDPKGRAVRTAARVGQSWLVSCTRYTDTDRPERQWGPVLMSDDAACPPQAAPAPLVDRAYDELDRLASQTVNLTAAEGGSRTTVYAYFADGQLKDVTQAAGTADASTVSYTYTLNGKPGTLNDGRNNRSTYSYDGHDRLARLAYPATAAGAGASSSTDYEDFGYDANGNPNSHRRRNGVTVTMAYDNLDRRTRITYPAPAAADSVNFTYDLLGRRLSASRTDHALTYSWDNAGRMLSTSAGGRTLSYQYDAAGNRTRTTWPDGFFVTTSYDVLDRPTSMRQNGNVDLVSSYTYDDLSRRAVVTLGNGTTTTYGYGDQGRLSRIRHNLAANHNDVIFDYTRNRMLDVATRTVTSANASYRWQPAAAANVGYASNGLNQYTAVGGVAMSYDNRGNLTGDGTWTWTYDEANQLRTGVRAGVSVALAYDGEGRLRQETLNSSAVTQFLYDGADLVAEYGGTGTLLRRHVHGPGVDEPIVTYEGAGTANRTWLYADHQGSIVAAANAAGGGTAVHAYGPFGEPNVTTGSRFKYTGQAHMPNLGLYYYKARFYSPALGRFLQPDPIGYDDGPNMYAYVGNNPMNRVDPTGLAAEEHHGGFGGIRMTPTAAVTSAGSFLGSIGLGGGLALPDFGGGLWGGRPEGPLFDFDRKFGPFRARGAGAWTVSKPLGVPWSLKEGAGGLMGKAMPHNLALPVKDFYVSPETLPGFPRLVFTNVPVPGAPKAVGALGIVSIPLPQGTVSPWIDIRAEIGGNSLQGLSINAGLVGRPNGSPVGTGPAYGVRIDFDEDKKVRQGVVSGLGALVIGGAMILKDLSGKTLPGAGVEYPSPAF